MDSARTRRTTKAVTVLGAVGLLAAGALVPATAADEQTMGRFSAPFTEPVVYDFAYDEDGRKVQVGEATTTDDKCIESPREDDGNRVICKPAAGSLALLPDGRIVYWSALEATENVELGAVPEFGLVAENDQTRVLTLNTDDPSASTWELPFPNGGGATNDAKPLLDGALIDQGGETNADGALFGADQVFLADGRLLAASGTDYYNEFGAIELEGLRASRIFDPETTSWEATGDLNIGRWYPTLITQSDGDVLAFSGVTKLIKPIYADGEAPTDSGTNVLQAEVYDLETGTWTQLPDSANRSLPLYPRMRLLPNGNVLFDTAGQTWDPAGYSYSEAVWNIAATFDPRTQTWTDHGVPGADGSTGLDLAYRGSGSTVMLPLRPNADGEYDNVELLNSGGHPGTSPGSYVGQAFSRITEVAIDGDSETVSHRSAGNLNQGRWYGHSTLLPTGEVFLTSGADVDHVIAPGSERARLTPELFDPETETWTQVAPQGQARTYHNSATLLPDGTVLVGGHNPIPTGYGSHMTIPGNAPNDGRDPSFEIYEPPYLFRGDRPVIKDVDTDLELGQTLDIKLEGMDAEDIRDVVLVRHGAETHIIDGDQRTVELPILEANNKKLEVQLPSNGSVLPPGPYMLFVNRTTDDGPVPSEAALVTVAIGDDTPIVGSQETPEQTVVDQTLSMIGAESGAVEAAPASPGANGLATGSLVALAAAGLVALRRRRTV